MKSLPYRKFMKIFFFFGNFSNPFHDICPQQKKFHKKENQIFIFIIFPLAILKVARPEAQLEN